MIVDITNEIIDIISTALPTVDVLSANPEIATSFPCMVITELENTSALAYRSSSGDEYSSIGIKVEIFTIGDTKTTDAKTIRNSVDSILADEYSMNRSFTGEVPNYSDKNIYRYTMIYDCTVNDRKQIFRR